MAMTNALMTGPLSGLIEQSVDIGSGRNDKIYLPEND